MTIMNFWNIAWKSSKINDNLMCDTQFFLLRVPSGSAILWRDRGFYHDAWSFRYNRIFLAILKKFWIYRNLLDSGVSFGIFGNSWKRIFYSRIDQRQLSKICDQHGHSVRKGFRGNSEAESHWFSFKPRHFIILCPLIFLPFISNKKHNNINQSTCAAPHRFDHFLRIH